jgi:hypothetical protein
MALPLPRVVSDVGPGGPLVTAMGGINSLAHNMLKRKWYAPDIESQINNRNAMTEGQQIMNQYMPDKFRLANAMADLQNQYYGAGQESEINNRNAMTERYNTMTPLEAKKLELQNLFYPDVTKSNISAQKSLEDFRKMGGGGAGVDQKQLQGFQNQISLDNPSWDQNQINQAASAYLSGETTMPDGSPLPPASGLAQQYLDLMSKKTTTAALQTGGVKAKQAEAELEVLNKYANEGLKPYGTTYNDMNAQQILDSFRSDKASQLRLGKFIASQALQYEAAQNRVRLANGQPGITATEGLMRASQQIVNAKFPRLSYEARQEATRFMDEALKKGLEARNSVGITASSLRNKKNTGNKSLNRANSDTHDIPPGYIALYKKGDEYFFPPEKVKQKLGEGFSYE